MNDRYDAPTSKQLEELYGTKYITEVSPGYKPYSKAPKKRNPLFDKAIFSLVEKLSIESVVKELVFALIAMATYVFIYHKGMVNDDSFLGYITSIALTIAIVFNLFKAAINSLTPGILCMGLGVALSFRKIPIKNFEFITSDIINLMIGLGAFYIAISLFKSSNN